MSATDHDPSAKRILVSDDDALARDFVSRCLQEIGYTTLTAEDATRSSVSLAEVRRSVVGGSEEERAFARGVRARAVSRGDPWISAPVQLLLWLYSELLEKQPNFLMASGSRLRRRSFLSYSQQLQ